MVNNIEVDGVHHRRLKKRFCKMRDEYFFLSRSSDRANGDLYIACDERAGGGGVGAGYYGEGDAITMCMIESIIVIVSRVGRE